MKKDAVYYVGIGIMIGIGIMMVGFLIDEQFNDKTVYGKWKVDENGSHWICVDVTKVNYSEAIDICEHEVGHEIFANECAKNLTNCMGVIG